MSRSKANWTLLLIALIWGTTFVAQQWVMQGLGAFAYTGTRFLLGALVVWPLAWREGQRTSSRQASNAASPNLGHPKNMKIWIMRLAEKAFHARLAMSDWAAMFGLGLLLFLGAALQQIGIGGTTVSNAGFLTALYVPLVPLMAWGLHGQKPHLSVWPALLGSITGTYLLSGADPTQLVAGDWWVIASTVFWAGHVVYIGRVAAHTGRPLLLATMQFATCGVVSLLWSALTETTTWAAILGAWPAILYGGLLSVGVGFTLQAVVQRYTRAADAAILLSSEILFAALAGAIVLGERLGPVQLAGCGLIFISILIVQLVPLWLERGEAAKA